MKQKIIYNDTICKLLSWFMEVGAIAIFPVVFMRTKYKYLRWGNVIRNHEAIHFKQQLEMLVLPFYIWYGVEFIIRFIQEGDTSVAYKKVSFEKECRSKQLNLDYLERRKAYSWFKYL